MNSQGRLLVFLIVFNTLSGAQAAVPVFCVHGVDQGSNAFRPLLLKLHQEGFLHTGVADVSSRHGEIGVKQFAQETERQLDAFMTKTKAKQVDIVAFSMGALASRYMIQRLNVKHKVRKFISISAPHRGTYAAYWRYFQPAMQDMVPGSELLQDLEQDQEPFGRIQLYAFYTPLDLIIFPPTHSLIDGAQVKNFNHVAIHHLMLKDHKVHAAVLDALRE